VKGARRRDAVEADGGIWFEVFRFCFPFCVAKASIWRRGVLERRCLAGSFGVDLFVVK